MDPTPAITVADKLATGNVQTILAIAAVAFACVAGWAIWRVIAEIKACGEERTRLATACIEAQHATADALAKNTAAIESHSEVMKLSLEALRAR